MYRMRPAVALLIFFGTVNSIVLKSSRTTTLLSSFPSRFSSNSPQWFRFRVHTRLNGSKNEGGETTSGNGAVQATETDDPKWELMEDWSLQDKVPDFTVTSSTGRATFWSQLKHTVPELSSRTEQELNDRYNELKLEPPKQPLSSNGKETTTTVGTPFIDSGESPEVLSDWWMDIAQKKSSAIMMMYGRLPNGSNVWFPLQSAGTVGSGNTNNNEREGFSWLVEDGDYVKYVESSAGCIYELGTPKTGSMETLFESDNNQETNKNGMALGELSASTTSMGMAFSAAALSSLLSAALAFNVGQASLPPPQPTAPVQSSAIVPRSSSQAITPAIVGSGMKYERILQKDGSVKVVEMSIGEQRASQELKLYRGERRLTNLQEKLASDEIALKELAATEAKLGPEAASQPLVDGMPRSPKELSISEQRARAELKIGADKRRIMKLKETLSNDKIKLKDLQAQEKQQQGPQRFFRNN